MASESFNDSPNKKGPENQSRRDFILSTVPKIAGAVGAGLLGKEIYSAIKNTSETPKPMSLEERNVEISHQLALLDKIGPEEAGKISEGMSPAFLDDSNSDSRVGRSAKQNVRYWLQNEFIQKKRAMSQTAIVDYRNSLLDQLTENKKILDSVPRQQ